MSEGAVELEEVRGPSALGGGWRRSLELLYLIAVTEFKKTYFGTALGYLWSVGRPLMLFAVLLAVFTQAFHIGSQVPHYAVLLLLNIVLMGFFQEATSGAVDSIVVQEGVVRKTKFPRIVIPLSVVLTSLFNLSLNLLVAFVFILAFGVSPMWTWLLFPVVFGLLFVLTIAMSMILSSLFPRFRDVGVIWSVLAAALFYATPVIYAIQILPETIRHLIFINPLTPLFVLVQKWVINPHAPSPSEAAGGYALLLVPAAIFVALCVFAVWIFNREAPRIAEEL
ncbi:MAG TPA: ABC transporter permease [Solirubrobacteraceae bacterium]|nr:ABC transporter permease [Solirubrobacteraceae bacterium]